MIFGRFSGALTPIALTFMLLVYLLIIELGKEERKKDLLPIVVSMGIVFLIVVVLNVWSKL